MDAKWWPVIIIPCIGLAFVIVGIKFMTDLTGEATRTQRRGGVCVAIGVACMVLAGLVGAFMSI
ncbi:hypothetical protein [Mariniluteicoccus flavus]